MKMQQFYEHEGDGFPEEKTAREKQFPWKWVVVVTVVAIFLIAGSTF